MATLDAPRATWTVPVGAFRQIGWAFLCEGLYADLLAGRIDEAYASTTADFKICISRRELR
jgi:hypothetical protein